MTSLSACRLRVVILFALRYEKEGRAQIADLVQRLQDFGMSQTQLGCVRTICELAGADSRIGDLFSNRSFSSRFSTFAKQSLKVSPCSRFHVPVLPSIRSAGGTSAHGSFKAGLAASCLWDSAHI